MESNHQPTDYKSVALPLSYNGINEPHGCSVGRLKGGDADEMNHHYIPNDSIKYTICNPNTI